MSQASKTLPDVIIDEALRAMDEGSLVLKDFVARQWEDDKRRLVCNSYPSEKKKKTGRVEKARELLEHYDRPELRKVIPEQIASIVEDLNRLIQNNGFMPEGMWLETLKGVCQHLSSEPQESEDN